MEIAFCLHLEWPVVFPASSYIKCMDPIIPGLREEMNSESHWRRPANIYVSNVVQPYQIRVFKIGTNISTNLEDIANIRFIVARFAQIRSECEFGKKKKNTKFLTFSQIFSFYNIPFGFTTSF